GCHPTPHRWVPRPRAATTGYCAVIVPFIPPSACPGTEQMNVYVPARSITNVPRPVPPGPASTFTGSATPLVSRKCCGTPPPLRNVSSIGCPAPTRIERGVNSSALPTLTVSDCVAPSAAITASVGTAALDTPDSAPHAVERVSTSAAAGTTRRSDEELADMHVSPEPHRVAVRRHPTSRVDGRLRFDSARACTVIVRPAE